MGVTQQRDREWCERAQPLLKMVVNISNGPFINDPFIELIQQYYFGKRWQGTGVNGTHSQLKGEGEGHEQK